MRSSRPDAAGPARSRPGGSEGPVAVIIPAAGRGDRLGSGGGPDVPPGLPKALRPLGGVPLLVHAVRTVAPVRGVTRVVVAAPSGAIDAVECALRGAVPTGSGAVPASESAVEIEVVSGGAERPDSVAAALAVLPAGVDIVLVHDAARPLTPRPVVEAVVGAVRAGAAGCVPVLPVCDTVKQVAADTIVRTVDRSSLRAVQTPQGFRRTVLEEAYAELARQGPGEPVTDDAGLVERLGVPVAAVPGSDEAFKITRPLDLLLAEALLAGRTGGR